MVIRRAEASDGTSIGLVHVRTWQSAYRGVLPQPFLDGLDAHQRGDYWEHYLSEGTPPGEEVVVAEEEGTVVGFASVGPSGGRRWRRGSLGNLPVGRSLGTGHRQGTDGRRAGQPAPSRVYRSHALGPRYQRKGTPLLRGRVLVARRGHQARRPTRVPRHGAPLSPGTRAPAFG